MASFGYSDTYYNVYYNFVTDTDALAGADTGSASAFQPVSSADTVHGTDAASPAHAALSSADTRPAATETGSVSASGFIFSADAFSSTDGGEQIGVTDTDFTNNYEVDLLADTDAGAFSDLFLSVVPFSTDAFSAAEAFGPLLLSAADFISSFDQAQAFPIGLHGTDTLTSAEATGFLPAFPFSSSDAGTFTGETGLALPDIFGADAAAFSDAQALTAHISDADTVSLADSGIATVPLSAADTATGAELAFAGPGSADAASGTDAATVQVVGSDSCAGEEGSAFPDNPIAHEFGVFREASSVKAAPSSADFIRWQEQRALAYPAGYLESFSISRAAVMSGGSEVGQLYGVRSGTMTPVINTTSAMGDDVVLGIWNDISAIQVSVVAGFLPYPDAGLILGWDTASNAALGRYALSFGQQGMSPSIQFSLVLRCAGRDYIGQPRTLDLLLYQVSFQHIAFTAAYKSGMEVTYTAFATSGFADELGNPLVTREYGRLVNSPLQPAGAILSVFGQGT